MVKPMIFERGQICGGRYLIERLHTHVPIAETYLAKDMSTGQEVLVTCSWLDDSTKHLRASFLSNVTKLRQIKAECSPRILAGDVADWGAWWVAREHFADAVPLYELITSDVLESPFLAKLHLGLVRGDVTSYLFLILTLVVKVGQTLRRFSAHGFHHGGLDPTQTIALRGNGTPIVLDAGYRELFGASYFDALPQVAKCRAPESSARRMGDARGDIYALGFILHGVLAHGMTRNRLQPLTTLVSQLEPMRHAKPSKRPEDWDEVISSFEAPYDELLSKVVHRAKTKDDVSNAVPQANDPSPESGPRSITTENGANTDPSPSPFVIEPDKSSLAAGAPALEGYDEAKPVPNDVDIATFAEAPHLHNEGMSCVGTDSDAIPQGVGANVDAREAAWATTSTTLQAPTDAAPIASDEAPTPRLPLAPSLLSLTNSENPAAEVTAPRAPMGRVVPDMAAATMISSVRPVAAPAAPNMSQQASQPLKINSPPASKIVAVEGVRSRKAIGGICPFHQLHIHPWKLNVYVVGCWRAERAGIAIGRSLVEGGGCRKNQMVVVLTVRNVER